MGFKIEEILGKEVSIIENNELVLTYCYGDGVLSSYFHPLYAPNGENITEEYAENNPFGLCFSFGTVFDATNEKVNLKRNNTTLESEITETDASGVCANLIGKTQWKCSNIEILEICSTTVHSLTNNVRDIDITIEIHTDTHPITFMDNIGLGYSAAEMEHRKTANADGRIGEIEVNQQASKWATLYGISANATVGVAILPHPSNGKTSFLAKDAYQGYLFAQTPQFTLDANTSQTLKYRVVIYVGDIFTIDLDQYYDNYIV